MSDTPEKISFTVTAVKELKSRKKGETSFKSVLVLNSENQEKAQITTPEDGSWDHVKPGDVVTMNLAVKQRTLSEIEAEEKAKADERKKTVAAAKDKAAPRIGGHKRSAATA